MRKRTFTEEQVEFVRDNMKSMSTRECAERFSERFGVPTGQTVIRRVMKHNQIQASVKRNDFLPVGTEKYSDYYQCMVVKTGEYHCEKGVSAKERNRERNKNWALKQNIVWEKANGRKLQWREVVIFLDGDRMNYDPDNLYAVPLNVAGTIEKMRMHSENDQIYKTALIWGQLYFNLKGVGTRR